MLETKIIIKHGGKRRFGFFAESEFKLKCSSNEPQIMSHEADPDLITACNFLRKKFGSALKVNSFGRSPKYNASLSGSAEKSFHLMQQGRPIMACDLSPANGDINSLKNAVLKAMPALKAIGIRGVGFYPTFVHIDTGNRGDDGTYSWGGTQSQMSSVINAKPAFNILEAGDVVSSYSTSNFLRVWNAIAHLDIS